MARACAKTSQILGMCVDLLQLSFDLFQPVLFQKPFDVVIEASVLVLMDVHAHQCKTEVIGMLGGQYLEEQGRLQVTMAQPCDSLSTHVQCEMDPGECVPVIVVGCISVTWCNVTF